jgi:hypothetical protein
LYGNCFVEESLGIFYNNMLHGINHTIPYYPGLYSSLRDVEKGNGRHLKIKMKMKAFSSVVKPGFNFSQISSYLLWRPL